jgi:hypothetical protein
MRGKLMTKLLVPVVAGLLLAGPGTAAAAESCAKQGSSATQSPEVSFSLTQLPEDPSRYSLVISDTEERSISGSFSLGQLQILRVIMVEGAKFALSEEAVNPKEPVTTRFKDKKERAFIVDVQKVGNQSLLFLTLTTELGRLTMDAGKVIRSTQRRDGFFFDLLSRLESMLPKVPAQPGK